MKKLLFLLMIAILSISIVFNASGAILSPGMLVLSANDPMIVSGLINEPLAFTTETFENHSGITNFQSITLTSIPEASSGYLSISGEKITEGRTISKDQINKLIFTPEQGVSNCSFKFSIDENYQSVCTLNFNDKFNYSPVATPSLCAVETFSNMSVSGHMVAYDPEGDSLIYELKDYPQNGTITYNKNDGSFIYTSSTAGKDSFTFVVKDNFGNYSEKAVIELSVSGNTTGTSFSDMENNGAYAAAVHMVKENIMECTETDGNVYFNPTSTISRVDFLVAAMNIMGANNLPTVSSTGFADDNDIPSDKKSYVYSAHKLGIISGTENSNGEKTFHPSNAITRAEASVILNNILGYSANSSYNFDDAIPVWAQDAINSMYELGVLSPENGCANAMSPMTKSDAALLFHKLSSLVS